MKITPQNDYVLIKSDPDQKTSAGGLFLPVMDEMKQFGSVEALPNPKPDFMKNLEVGDRVIFGKENRQIIEKGADGVETILTPFYNLLAVIETD